MGPDLLDVQRRVSVAEVPEPPPKEAVDVGDGLLRRGNEARPRGEVADPVPAGRIALWPLASGMWR